LRKKIIVSEDIKDPTIKRERQVAEWMIKEQFKWSKPIIILKFFTGKVGEDPISFLENLVVDVEANRWDETDLLKVIGGFLKDNARE